MYRGDNFVAEKPIIDNHEKSIEFIFVPVCRLDGYGPIAPVDG
jgi:hypothetical protein